MKYKEQDKARFHVKVENDQYELLNPTFGTEPENMQEAIEWATRRLVLENQDPDLPWGAVIFDQREYDQKDDVYLTDGSVAFYKGDGIWDSSGEKLEIRDAELRELYQTQRDKLSRARDLRGKAVLLEFEAEQAEKEAADRESHLNLESPSSQTAVVEEEPAEMSASFST